MALEDLPDAQRDQARRLLEDYQKRMPPPTSPDFYQVEDICGRVSGIGSMGRLRYAVLVAGKGSAAARNVLLEKIIADGRPNDWILFLDDDAFLGEGYGVQAIEKIEQAERLLGYKVATLAEPR